MPSPGAGARTVLGGGSGDHGDDRAVRWAITSRRWCRPASCRYFRRPSRKGVIVCDAHGRVLYCNDIARDLCLTVTHEEGGARLIEQTSPDGGVGSFVGYALNDPDALADQCNLGVSSRDVTLDQGTVGRLITLEPRNGAGRRWDEPLKERFALTDREIEVLNRLMAGGSNREISQGALYRRVYRQEAHPEHLGQSRSPHPHLYRACSPAGARAHALTN